jgi:hypothetical protein
MDNGYIKLTELIEKLQAVQQASFRMVLQEKEGQWLLHTLLVDVLPEELLMNAPTYCYDYEYVVFIAGRLSGTQLVSWLQNKHGEIDGYSFQYAIQQDITQSTTYWMRHPSNASTLFPKIPFPFTHYGLPQPSVVWGFPSGLLVNDSGPFFPSVQQAIAQLIYEVTDPNQLGATSQTFSVRLVHDEACIRHIEISPLLLSIEISGPPDLTFETEVDHPQRVDCPLPQGMPPEVWVVLSRGNQWLDYVYLSQRWSPFKKPQESVSISPPDIGTQIQEFVAQGEGLKVEFKQEIPQEHDKMLKTVVAFANGAGGVILLGVTDDGDSVGIQPRENINKEKDRIINMIRNTISPDPLVRIEHWDIDGRGERFVVAIFVDEGTAPLYGLHSDKPEIYVRRQATTFRARLEEISGLAKQK